MSQSSPGSLTGASSADATVMTIPTGSQVSGEGRVASLETTIRCKNRQRKEDIEEIYKINIAKNEYG